MSLKKFYKLYPYFDTQELIEYYSIFDGFKELETLHVKDNIFQSIEENILLKYQDLKKYFIYSNEDDLQKLIESALIRLARGDRKSHSIYKKEKIPQPQGKQIYKHLFEIGVIKKEFSREKPFKQSSKQPLKKELRRYTIEDKIHFCNESTRFWFTFIAPNSHLLEKGEIEEVMKQIIQEFEKYVSLTFETLSGELLEATLKEEICESGSYWDRKIEIDLLIVTHDGMRIAGESKWKNHKLCKNVLNSLQKKAKLVNLEATHFALFSKSGFSKELEDMRDEHLLLFTLDDFERLFLDR